MSGTNAALIVAVERQIVLLEEQRVVLTAILAELQSWRQPQSAPQPACAHPDGLRQDMSSMGEIWIRCRGCGADVVRKEKP